MAKYQCTVCGYIYDEEKEGQKWEDLPEDWVCPACDSGKTYFKGVEAAQSIICGVCGYIIKGEPGDVCPACGVPKTAFKPYPDPLSPSRRKVLDFHFHGISVHFPQAFSVFMFLITVVPLLLTGPAGFTMSLMVICRFLSIFLPLSVLAALLTGLLDGQTRFKRINTPVLKKKITVGILFLIFSMGVPVILFFLDSPTMVFVGVPVLLTLCVFCSIFLGYNGGRLTRAEVPG